MHTITHMYRYPNQTITLAQLREWYCEELMERVTDPRERCSEAALAAVQRFSEGGTLPQSYYFQDFLSFLLQRDGIVNRHELYEKTRGWFQGYY